MKITISRWDDFQHYGKRRPPWVKVHRQLLDNRHWFDLSHPSRSLLIELWLIASETLAGCITCDLEDLTFRLHRKQENISACLQELVAHGFIELCEQYASAVLATCSPETETETDQRQSSVSKDTGASSDVDNSEKEKLRGEFAQLVREHLWQSKDPPSKGWSMGREISVRGRLIGEGQSPLVINGVVERYKGEPATMRIYWSKQCRPRWEQDKNAYLKSLPPKAIKLSPKASDILSAMQTGA